MHTIRFAVRFIGKALADLNDVQLWKVFAKPFGDFHHHLTAGNRKAHFLALGQIRADAFKRQFRFSASSCRVHEADPDGSAKWKAIGRMLLSAAAVSSNSRTGFPFHTRWDRLGACGFCPAFSAPKSRHLRQYQKPSWKKKSFGSRLWQRRHSRLGLSSFFESPLSGMRRLIFEWVIFHILFPLFSSTASRTVRPRTGSPAVWIYERKSSE